jgi:hypothetical protein
LFYYDVGQYISGVSGSILSLATMAFVYMTFQIQKKQIVMQQGQIESQKKDNAENEKRLKISALDDWFFKLFQLHNETVRMFDIRGKTDSSVKSAGKDCFKVIYNSLVRASVDKRPQGHVVNTPQLPALQDVVEVFRNNVYPEFEGDLDSYFKSIGAVLRQVWKIEDSKLSIDISMYCETIRSQLSTFELVIIYYFCHIDDRHLSAIQQANKRLINTYGIMRDMPNDKLIPTR